MRQSLFNSMYISPTHFEAYEKPQLVQEDKAFIAEIKLTQTVIFFLGRVTIIKPKSGISNPSYRMTQFPYPNSPYHQIFSLSILSQPHKTRHYNQAQEST